MIDEECQEMLGVSAVCNVLTGLSGLAKNLEKPFDYKKLTEAENSNCSNLYFVMVYNGI